MALLFMVAACTGVPSGIDPVEGFDVRRYAGTWYEIMRLDHSFERGLVNVTATYGLRDDGSISVVNRGYRPEECAWDSVDGTATFQSDVTTASLSVTFFWPFAGGYHVFELDKETYGHALVAGPTRDFLWILARTPDLPAATRHRLIDTARQNGFPVDDLILVEHGVPEC